MRKLKDAPDKEYLNPGSNKALAAGCKCPVLDNNHGWGSEWGKGKFWVSELCPMHGKKVDPDGPWSPR